MQVIIGGVEYSSAKVPIAIKFTVNDLKCIVEGIKKGILVFATLPKGGHRPALFNRYYTLAKYKDSVKALLKPENILANLTKKEAESLFHPPPLDMKDTNSDKPKEAKKDADSKSKKG